jgi:hypothetical protein
MTLFAVLLALAAPTVRLAIAPWTGSDLQTTSAHAAKYRLEVSGRPNASVRLQASGVANGWLAAFCTPSFCSPKTVDVRLPASGQAVVQFELIREAADAPKASAATITESAGASVHVPEAYRD